MARGHAPRRGAASLLSTAGTRGSVDGQDGCRRDPATGGVARVGGGGSGEGWPGVGVGSSGGRSVPGRVSADCMSNRRGSHCLPLPLILALGGTGRVMGVVMVHHE